MRNNNDLPIVASLPARGNVGRERKLRVGVGERITQLCCVLYNVPLLCCCMFV